MTLEQKQAVKRNQEMLGSIVTFATAKHAGQFDKGGVPYIFHTLKVCHYLKTDDQELQCIAVGHDLLEDTDTTCADLREIGMSERVIAGILALTKIPGETYEEYKAKVKSNPDAVKVKMSDLRHNMDIRRLKGATQKDIARMAKYSTFYLELVSLDLGVVND
jgi:guanosine-3',5'-bis(diphosphate) 3'-pyrophosphohydrolase